MDVNSNKYTYTFAIIMVVIVAAILTSAAIVLKPFQDANVELEKKQNILQSIGLELSRDEAEKKYKDFIKEELVVRNGKVVENPETPAFEIDMAAAIRQPIEEREVPLYVAEKDGKKIYIVPMRGRGLWGPIWGYLAVEEDGKTVAGANFDHKSETPGLGAEISTPMFEDQFPGKKFFDGSDFKSIRVVKAGNASEKYEVDGISGGTITSNGVDDMIEDNLKSYLDYFKNK